MLEDRYYFKDYYYVLWQSLDGDSLSAKPNANFVWNSEELWGGGCSSTTVLCRDCCLGIFTCVLGWVAQPEFLKIF